MWSNDVYVCRHGESEANVLELIVSGSEDCSFLTGIDQYGLTFKGEKQAKKAADVLSSLAATSNRKVIIVSSNFRRAKETADILAAAANVAVLIDPRLRERWFGDFNGASSHNYERVWEEDRQDPTKKHFNAESVQDVYHRTQELLRELDASNSHAIIVLVSHGDTLQICQTWVEGRSLTEHRLVEHLDNAILRK
eukprot:gene4882-8693_t